MSTQGHLNSRLKYSHTPLIAWHTLSSHANNHYMLLHAHKFLYMFISYIYIECYRKHHRWHFSDVQYAISHATLFKRPFEYCEIITIKVKGVVFDNSYLTAVYPRPTRQCWLPGADRVQLQWGCPEGLFCWHPDAVHADWNNCSCPQLCRNCSTKILRNAEKACVIR